jgi:hypothetical protein
MGMLKNVAIIAWRLLDFNRFFEFFTLIILIRKFWRSKIKFQKTTLLYLLLLLGLILFPTAIGYANLSAHRYFLPLMLTLHVFVYQLIVQSDWSRFRKITILLLIALLNLLGNLQIYPRGISMDWDSTLAHLPYYELRREAVRDLEAEGVDFSLTGSAFPNLGVEEELELNGDTRQFVPFNLETNQWVMVSNVYNDIQERDYRALEQQWQAWRRYERRGVWIILYHRPATLPFR